MEIRSKLYPYPVLRIENDDYNTSKFDCEMKLKRDIRKFEISVNFILTNDELKQMIEEDRMEYVLHIECPQTAYRTILKTKKSRENIILLDKDLRDKITISPFIIAKIDNYGYSNSDWNIDYKNISFDYEKGSIVAIGSQNIFTVHNEDIDLENLPSIFSIYKRETVEDLPAVIEIDNDKIKIGLNIDTYDRYASNVNYGDKDAINLVNSMLIFPALVYTLEELRQSFDTYREYKWFIAFVKMYEKYGKKFDENLVIDENIFELVQILMQNPINKALEGLDNLREAEEEM